MLVRIDTHTANICCSICLRTFMEGILLDILHGKEQKTKGLEGNGN